MMTPTNIETIGNAVVMGTCLLIGGALLADIGLTITGAMTMIFGVILIGLALIVAFCK